MSETVVSPLSITMAALITQFCLSAVVLIGALVMHSGDPRIRRLHAVGDSRSRGSSSGFFSVSLIFTLVTVAVLLVSDEFAGVWRPILGELSFNGISWSIALLSILLLDVLWVTILVYRSGGSRKSAFGPIFFIIPALALFLRQPPLLVIVFLILVAAAFSFGMVYAERDSADKGGRRRSIAFWFVSIACFSLTTLIGCVTRPF